MSNSRQWPQPTLVTDTVYFFSFFKNSSQCRIKRLYLVTVHQQQMSNSALLIFPCSRFNIYPKVTSSRFLILAHSDFDLDSAAVHPLFMLHTSVDLSLETALHTVWPLVARVTRSWDCGRHRDSITLTSWCLIWSCHSNRVSCCGVCSDGGKTLVPCSDTPPPHPLTTFTSQLHTYTHTRRLMCNTQRFPPHTRYLSKRWHGHKAGDKEGERNVCL